MVPPAFSGGVLLMQHTQLGHLRLLEGKPVIVVKGFLVGCLLALPPALLELMGNMQSQDTYIIHWWQPLYAIVPGIAEETWFRLLLLSFCYAVLRPAANQRPRRAIVVAILVSIFAFTFAHSGLNPIGFLYGLLFSMPHALLFIKKDFEHAVGYHFMIDFIRYIAAFIS
jgi:membrane protease YdiL (CAAX protease family)